MRFFAVGLVLLSITAVVGADWPHWRGPNFNGSTSEVDLPAEWSMSKNVAWVAELPGPSAATPIVSGDRVFVSSTDLQSGRLQAICFNRRNGKLIWQHEIGDELRRDTRSTYAAPSPVTDGNLVVFFYGNGELVAYDMEGEEQWSRNVQKDYGDFAFLWTFSSSPMLYNEKLYLQVLQRDVPVTRRRGGGRRGRRERNTSASNTTFTTAAAGIESYLLAIQPQTGETIWRQSRPSQAVAESREAFSSPIPFELNDQRQILVAGGDDLTAHDANTGKELWRWGTWNPTRIGHWRLVPSPVTGNNTILVCAPKRDPIYAVKAVSQGDSHDGKLKWDSQQDPEISSDVPTPAFADGDFFVLSDVRRTLARVDPETGKARWKVTTPGRDKYEASPTVADGKIYIVNFAGEVAVFDADNGELLTHVPMDPETSEHVVRSSVSASNGQLFIRTTSKLYCIGK